MSSDLERYIEKAAGDLPALPGIAAAVMKAVDDPNSSSDDIRKLIEEDPALAARILRVSNSALYGFRGKIQSLSHAISLIGLRATRNLVLGISMKSTFQHFGLMEKLLWLHSTAAGPVTAALAKHLKLGIDADEAFTAGLLHDVGKTALANSHRDEYERVVARVYNEQIGFVAAERDLFGFDHAELGARVAARWGFPIRLIAVIGKHHDADALHELPEDIARLTALVGVATRCLTRLGVGRRAAVEAIDPTACFAWEYLDLDKDAAESCLALCQEKVDAASTLTE
ncbi:MAG: HDOD domain-containing protein [Myxococcota bacterium]